MSGRFAHADGVRDLRVAAGAALRTPAEPGEDTLLLVLDGELEVAACGGARTLGPGGQAVLPHTRRRPVRALTDAWVLCLAVPA